MKIDTIEKLEILHKCIDVIYMSWYIITVIRGYAESNMDT